MKKVIFINSHPIQYFAPLYTYMQQQGVDVEAWYCSDESIRGATDKQFGQKVQWDIPLLEGYKYRFFKNYSPRPSIHKGFWGLMNFGMIQALRRQPGSVVIVHGWAYCTNILVLLFAYLTGHTVCLRAETPLQEELQKSRLKLGLRKALLRFSLFPLIHKFLYIGDANRRFYEYYKVPARKLLFTPYSVDNERFSAAAAELMPRRSELRAAHGIPEKAFVFLFCGKYITKKRPLDVLQAFCKANLPDSFLLMVGEGELRKEMEAYIAENKLSNVQLTGFINQGAIVNYYAMSDALVIASQHGETWGLVVNEAMNFGLPVIASDQTGSATDLVQEGINGFRFQTGQIDQLKNCLREMALADNEKQGRMRAASKSIVENYSYAAITRQVEQILIG